MSKFETKCPHCRMPNAVEKSSFGALANGLQTIQCCHCSKSWSENLGDSEGLSKSAGMPELAKLIAELQSLVNARLGTQAPANGAKFVAKSADSEVEVNDTVRQQLAKALANGKRVDVAEPEISKASRFQLVETVGVGVRTTLGGQFVPDGRENNDVAAAELGKALANPKMID
jgi:phage FluMu protein Com